MAARQWWISVPDARALQESLRDNVITTDDFADAPTVVAGVDVGVSRARGKVRAAVAVFELPELTLVESSVAVRKLDFPYIPGYLSFRELPAVLDALANLQSSVDALLCDGHGLIHPRRFGLACHLGVETGLVSVGIGKSPFVGTHGDVPPHAGAFRHVIAPQSTSAGIKGGRTEDRGLEDRRVKDEILGAALRNRTNVAPIYVSTGHRIGLESAIALVRACTTKYRLPETTRAADRLAAHAPISR